ncbi:hypothetical protein N7510_005608 [Penicillium lagena]|uniref:uncharacterized protein n=1 Tax=Penicillium lagena TaxID=94218 RepID=UPI002541288F|nr:uncharacterized protein N7510_005608 [Penicillium lagena]KAJ5612414.1 hypothetical protein N7510_005608 [Penicillium lagena]
MIATVALNSLPNVPSPDDPFSVAHIPDSLLRAELLRRDADSAACGTTERGAYNTPLHVMALFLILGLSTFGTFSLIPFSGRARLIAVRVQSACSFPILARRFPRLPIPRRFLFISRHFGTGVLIATAFVHLLPTAFVSLTDPCLPRFWSVTYRAMAGFVAMISVFAVVCVEMFFAMKGAGHVHGNEYDNLIGEIGRDSMSDFGPEGTSYSRLEANEAPDNIRLDNLDNHRVEAADRPSGSSHGSDQRRLTGTLSDKERNDGETDDDTPANGHTSRTSHQHLRPRLSGSYRHQTHSELPIQNPQRQLLQCLLLEAGILFHSIFIGMALSVATGTSFIVLLVAIGFHQTFEGFALGSRIASLIPDLFAPSSMKPWLMSLAYGTTTPLGQAIGLVLHNLYDPASTTGLLMVGITNAISSGLLLFAGLVELLAEDFLSESSYENLKGRRRIEACVSVACGAILMAFVGAFA